MAFTHHVYLTAFPSLVGCEERQTPFHFHVQSPNWDSGERESKGCVQGIYVQFGSVGSWAPLPAVHPCRQPSLPKRVAGHKLTPPFFSVQGKVASAIFSVLDPVALSAQTSVTVLGGPLPASSCHSHPFLLCQLDPHWERLGLLLGSLTLGKVGGEGGKISGFS